MLAGPQEVAQLELRPGMIPRHGRARRVTEPTMRTAPAWEVADAPVHPGRPPTGVWNAVVPGLSVTGMPARREGDGGGRRSGWRPATGRLRQAPANQRTHPRRCRRRHPPQDPPPTPIARGPSASGCGSTPAPSRPRSSRPTSWSSACPSPGCDDRLHSHPGTGHGRRLGGASPSTTPATPRAGVRDRPGAGVRGPGRWQRPYRPQRDRPAGAGGGDRRDPSGAAPPSAPLTRHLPRLVTLPQARP